MRVSRFLYRWLLAAAGALYLLTLGLRNPRHREFLYRIPTYWGYHPTHPLIPQVPLTEIVPTGAEINLCDPLPDKGEISLQELVCISALVRRFQPQRVLEIGTLGGRTTVNMMANTGPTAEVFTLDLPNTDYLRTTSTGQILGRQWTQLYGDSLTFDFSPLYNSMDFIFVDANHSYEHVGSDSLQALRMLRNKVGVIVWHDYTAWDWEGNTQALNELYTQDAEFGGLRHIEGTTLVCLIRTPTA